ncbi:hypothetical protein ACJMK2_017917 [Sinanodonta woodiana]|uniref:Histone-binding protein RBBP4-like N-terminal domain-containing protein n=2 Tax=Sinanodonta woodiana TaxID=1069815 RepID=A0ABD3UET6_SINWO
MEQDGCFHAVEEEPMCNEDSNMLDVNENVFQDLVVRQFLEWPSLTAQWLPDVTRPEGEEYSLHRLILGTDTSEDHQNYLMIANVQIPDENHRCHDIYCDQNSDNWKVEIQTKINHEGEVNKACYMPQNPSIIATQTCFGDVLVFDCTKQPSEPEPSGICSPQLTLKGHEQEGYGLSWNPNQYGYLVSASDDTAICLWDINSMSANTGVLRPIATFTEHALFVNDVEWHPVYQNMFGSVSNDETLMIWDTRIYDTVHIIQAHTDEINCLAFNPYREFILATGSADDTIALWDLRNMNSKLYSIVHHKEATIRLQWSPHNQNILASSGGDKRLYVWDVSNLVAEQSTDNATSDPHEMMFIGCQHIGEILEFSWNPNEPRLIGSVTWDKIVQIWKMADNDYYTELLKSAH